ncbi:MAG: hypothetical protein GX275_07880 [Clostridiales bacterium]|mgnify:CR=1 FL=1|nr:hypothetical protein [Clostridiales bacterium]
MESKNDNCPCKRKKCERHGYCTACKEHHRSKRKPLTACERIKAKEERKDRKRK